MGRQMSERADFHVMGQPLDGTPLHYTASGLDYVYLLNGFTVENDPDYGRMVTIDDENDLHRSIGLYVITRPRTLTGAEFRFLRKQMGFKQKDLENMQSKHSFKPLGPATGNVKTAIFSGNNARLYGINPKKAERELKQDRFAALKVHYDAAGREPSNLRYGYINTSNDL
jgi:hypothetical protein